MSKEKHEAFYQQKYNEQSTMREKYLSTSAQGLHTVDFEIAYSLYHFLIGATNKLPNYEKLNDVITNREYDLLSLACGLSMNSKLEITITEPISEIYTRYDIITPDKYTAYVCRSSYEYSDIDSKAIDIDVEEMPRFHSKRVKIIQEYLQNYKLLYQSNEKQFSDITKTI